MFKTRKKLQEEVNALKRELDELELSVMGAEVEIQKLNNALYDYIDKTANWQKLQAERAMTKPTINWEVAQISVELADALIDELRKPVSNK